MGRETGPNSMAVLQAADPSCQASLCSMGGILLSPGLKSNSSLQVALFLLMPQIQGGKGVNACGG